MPPEGFTKTLDALYSSLRPRKLDYLSLNVYEPFGAARRDPADTDRRVKWEHFRMDGEVYRTFILPKNDFNTDLPVDVLRAERQPWLVIDPKPFVGDPAYDATQHLVNCGARMHMAPHETIARFADLLEVDAERVRLWMFARAAAEARDEWTGVWMKVARRIAP